MAGVNNYNGMAYGAIPGAPNNGFFNNQVYPANSIPQAASPIYVHAIHRFESMMENERDPEMRMMMQEVIDRYNRR